MDSFSWMFRCYLDKSGADVIDAWRTSQSPEVQAAFDEKLRYLRSSPRELWVRPRFDILGGEGKGLGAIRFKCDRINYRVFGFFDGPGVFTLVLAATKTNRYQPRNACDIGLKRKAEIEADRRRAHDCDME